MWNRKFDNPIDRFKDGFIPVTESGCWLWMKSCNQYGYGCFRAYGRCMAPHRFAYHYYVGSIPSGLVVDHICRVRCCVNPDHLRLTTNQENVLSGTGVTAVNARKTHCKNGHEFTNSNTRNRAMGRGCLECHRLDGQKYRAKGKISYAVTKIEAID